MPVDLPRLLKRSLGHFPNVYFWLSLLVAPALGFVVQWKFGSSGVTAGILTGFALLVVAAFVALANAGVATAQEAEAELIDLREKQATKEDRQALEELIGEQIKKGEALYAKTTVPPSEAAFGAYNTWNDETCELILNSLGQPWADMYRSKSKRQIMWQGNKKGEYEHRLNNLKDLLDSLPHRTIRNEFLARLRSGHDS